MDLAKRFERVIGRLESRMDRSDRLLDDLTKFSRRALDEIYRIAETPVLLSRNAEKDYVSEEAAKEEVPVLMFGDQNLFNVGGATFVEKAFNIAKALWTEEERMSLCIDPKKTLDPQSGRKPGDHERTELYQKAVKFAFGDQYTNKLYRDSLKLVNQRLREKRAVVSVQ